MVVKTHYFVTFYVNLMNFKKINVAVQASYGSRLGVPMLERATTCLSADRALRHDWLLDSLGKSS
jgi:hypothetical protein